jgi:hypothetical protein
MMQHFVIGLVLADTDTVAFDFLEPLDYRGLFGRRQQTISHREKDIVFFVDMRLEQFAVPGSVLSNAIYGAFFTATQSIQAAGHPPDVPAAYFVLGEHHSNRPGFARHPMLFEFGEENILFLPVVTPIDKSFEKVDELAEVLRRVNGSGGKGVSDLFENLQRDENRIVLGD